MIPAEEPEGSDPLGTGERDELAAKGPRAASGRNQVQGTPTAHTLSQEALAERKREDQRFQHAERAKDNAQRRMFANIAGVIFLVLLAASFLVGSFGSNSDARSRAWDLVTVLVSGLLAAGAGYLAGRSGD